MNNKYRTLYFDEPEFDISQVQTTVKLKIYLGTDLVVWANAAGDLGGEPETLDATPLSAGVQMNKTGIQSLENWTIDYFYNPGDFGKIETLKSNKTKVNLKIEAPNGDEWTNSGVCTSNYATNISVNGLLGGHAVFELSNPDGWAWTPKTEQSLG